METVLIKKVLISDYDMDLLGEVIHGATGEILERSEVIKIFLSLPGNIRSIAEEWAFNDTVFRDEAFGWIQKNYKKGQAKNEIKTV